MAYRMVYLRIRSGGYNFGWASDADQAAFKEESRRLFQELGWTLHAGSNGICDTVTKGDQDDCVIVTGDFGGIWSGEQTDGHKLDWLEDKPFTTLFVDGNHDNFDLLNAYPEHEWHGGRVHQVRPHVLHLMRGQVFDIGGLTFFTMGGAASHDIQDGILDPAEPGFERKYWRMRRMGAYFRVLGHSWWPEEMPSEAEYAEAKANLERAGWHVDYVLTHCAPTSITKALDSCYQPDQLTDFLESVKGRCQFSRWFCGHYHVNQVIDERFVVQWEQMSKIE